MDLTGITNVNEYYTNHYLAAVFADNAAATISQWRESASGTENRTPWSMLRAGARQFYVAHDRFNRSRYNNQRLNLIKNMADVYLGALGYPEAQPEIIELEDDLKVPLYLEINKDNGAPALWVILAASKDKDAPILDKQAFYWSNGDDEDDINLDELTKIRNEDLANKIFYSTKEPPRFLILIGMNQIALLDRNKWNDKRYLQFELEDIFTRHEESTLQAMAVLLHKDSLCPKEGKALIDELDESSQKNANEVSDDLKYALRESIELLGNEVLYDMRTRQGINLDTNPVDPAQLTIECLRYMYRMLFVLFIESRTELGYAPKENTYLSAYSLESLRDIADKINDNVEEVGDGYYLHNSLTKLYDMIYRGYPSTEEEYKRFAEDKSKKDCFAIPPLKAHIFDPEFTQLITRAKIRNSIMLRIVKLMSITREKGGRNSRRGRISYANLGINQMGAVYEALLSYRGFIADQDLYEVKKAGSEFNVLEVGYFVSAQELEQYTEDERVYDVDEQGNKHLRTYAKGSFVYRLAGREREKSASYYTPECLTKCLVKYALKELLKDKTADEILQLTVCEPAMGSAAFLNEAINQLAEAYLSKKQEETNDLIKAEDRLKELQKVKMYIADRNVYGIDLNPIAVELAEVSLWLNTIYEGGYVPWFGTQLVNGNSLIGARRQCYRIENLKTTVKGMRWYEMAPERVALNGNSRVYKKPNTQIYHFLLGDPGMSNYTDKVIKELEPENIKKIKAWNKEFIKPYNDNDIDGLARLSTAIDKLWDEQVENRIKLEEATRDSLSVYGHKDSEQASHTSIREKDRILHQIYKSEQQRNAGAYARLKFAMDYWCALWFWPIENADLLPTRDAFFFDMDLILNGTLKNVANKGQQNLFSTEDLAEAGQLTQVEKMERDFAASYCQGTVVDIPMLCQLYPRLALVQQIAEQNHFMHWELEFADLFKERGGFDLIVGNPPWIKLEWNIKDVLSEAFPVIQIRNQNVSKIRDIIRIAFLDKKSKSEILLEYESLCGMQVYLNSEVNYSVLTGASVNLYTNFIPQSWLFTNPNGCIAYIHQDNVYTDGDKNKIRKTLYKKLIAHYHFINHKRLFDIGHTRQFSLNIYSNKATTGFETISNLYIPDTIDQCYENKISLQDCLGKKDKNGNWNTYGNKSRIIKVDKNALALFANVFDDGENTDSPRLPALQVREFLKVLECFSNTSKKLGDLENEICYTGLWDEPSGLSDCIFEEHPSFPLIPSELILASPNISICNMTFQNARTICNTHRAYDNIDLSSINDDFLPRCKYRPLFDEFNAQKLYPSTKWNTSYHDEDKVILRRRLDHEGARSLISCIIPSRVGYIDSIFGFAFKNHNIAFICGLLSSLPYDFFLRIINKSDARFDTLSCLPLLEECKQKDSIIIRTLLLNCTSKWYDKIWRDYFPKNVKSYSWSKVDNRLNKIFLNFEDIDVRKYLKNDFSRYQALVELDVLVSQALNLSLQELLSIYRIQYSVMNQYDLDTWYDSNGRIVFTNNRGLSNVGVTRQQWEKKDEMQPIKRGEEPWDGIMKNAPAGYVFAKTFDDDTMPGGPIERTIEYVAPFDRCDREKDYETAWRFFEEKYKDVKEV